MNANTNSVAEMVEHFKQYITGGIDPVIARKALTQLYVNYTRSLVRQPDQITNATEDQLYVLAEFIEILDGGY
ncbi:hypothetical protein IDJ75_10610 [Mucilaginibacter rigui]|uniref:Uncharacterized protein n=1 Tax=Mucilaginibacter rigui TaxID=534635 RepID=A0ABR7X6N1_9SPHI|nr:hypothetical protein [Mucilaginibacter rigui]MBD1385730.1 hypothetical protein [Mucilaginibacter rigui]